MSDHLDSRAAGLAAALDDFLGSSPDVEAAAVVSFDGLPMASALPDDLDEDRLGAMSAALLSLGEQAAVGLGRGQLDQVFVEGEHGFVFLMSCRGQAVLAAVAARPAKIGFMLYEMRRAADRVGAVLQPAVGPPVEVDDVPAAGGLASVSAWDRPGEGHGSDHWSDHGLDEVPAAPQVTVADRAPVEDPDTDLLSVLVAEPSHDLDRLRPEVGERDLLTEADERDLLTEALFEVRRATGGDTPAAPAWSRPETSVNGWG